MFFRTISNGDFIKQSLISNAPNKLSNEEKIIMAFIIAHEN